MTTQASPHASTAIGAEITGRRARASKPTTAIALLFVGLVPLLPTLRAAFVYDDTTIIRDNVLLRGWGALLHVWSQPYWPADGGVDVLGLYRPLHLALISVVWNAGAGSARWLHGYAWLLTAVTILSVWWMARRGVRESAALVGALWFAAHPLHVEAIASVANSSELLVVLCTAALVKVFAAPPALDDRARDWRRAATIGMLSAAALLAKESGLLAMPLAALTVWGWRRRDESSPTIREFLRINARALLAALFAISAVLLARSIVLGVPVARASIAAQGLDGLSAMERVRVMMSLWPRIAGMLAWPTSLAPYYGPTIFPAHRGAIALLSGIIVASVAGLALVASRNGDRRPLVAFGWIALSYFPASNLAAATGQIVSDRTLFGATVGVALAIAWALDCLPAFGRRVAMVLLAIVIARSMLVTTRYAVAWTTHRALWTQLVEAEPEEHLGYKLLGMDARARGDTTRALELLSRAYSMQPADRQIRFEFGQVLYATGRYSGAVDVIRPLLEDGEARAEPGLVSLYLDAVGRGRGPEAVVTAATTLLHSESAPVAFLFLGAALEQLHKYDAADSAYANGLRRAPANAQLNARRAALRATRGS